LKEYVAMFTNITQVAEIVLIMNVTSQRWGILFTLNSDNALVLTSINKIVNVRLM
jgi:hypothetical protein